LNGDDTSDDRGIMAKSLDLVHQITTNETGVGMLANSDHQWPSATRSRSCYRYTLS